MASLVLKDIEKSYPSFKLEIPSFEIGDGEFFGIVGVSGCGKTTLLRTIAGLTQPDRGQVFLSGRDVTSLPAEKRDMGMVFQQPRLFPYMTVAENLSFGLRMRGIKKKTRQRKVLELLPRLEMEGRGNSYPDELSGGQMQRIAIGRALIYKPSLLLMDEPFSALDPNLRQEMRSFIRHIHRHTGVTIIFVSHDRDDAFELFERMAFVDGGHLVETESPNELYENPQNEITARFMGAENLFPVARKDDIIRFCDMKIHTPGPDGDGWVVLRPEIFSLTDEGMIRGKVEEITIRQGETWLRAGLEDRSVTVKLPYSAARDMSEGDWIGLKIDLDEVRFIESGRQERQRLR